jgi:hypothetical protein
MPMPAGASREGGPPAQGVNQQGGGLISENQSQSCSETIKDSVLAFVRWVNCSEVEIHRVPTADGVEECHHIVTHFELDTFHRVPRDSKRTR